MIDLFCDESDDGETYALTGLMALPGEWSRIRSDWTDMLQTIAMPDGSPCPAFHTSEIVNRDLSSSSRFKGWSFHDETQAFIKAIDTYEPHGKVIFPLGCAIEVPSTFKDVQRDAVWMILFSNLLDIFTKRLSQRIQTVRPVFDDKPEIRPHVEYLLRIVEDIHPGLFGAPEFKTDEEEPALQIADLVGFEWRKRITTRRKAPEKPARRSYERLLGCMGERALWLYSKRHYDAAIKVDPVAGDQTTNWLNRVRSANPCEQF